ncbi:DUF116 domain-containing protein [Syntrophomonas wolfei]|jgi:hypothetical protein|uniref:DUF116 domain-containing protein n=1 Tax=Syntrophomonas wolfei TaxID=863 RepID=UPI000774C073|nr:DUF116 domain-containing protein [Syntrophomonas wolfei]
MEAKKRIYIGLLAASLFFAIFALFLLWYLISKREFIISQFLLLIILTLVILFFLILATGIIAIVFMILRSRSIPSLENITQLANEMLFPLTLIVGRLIGIEKEKILRSFIAVNNYLVRCKKLILKEEQIMLLVPHCLQNSDCPHKITVDVNNCKECGKCKVGELKKLAQEHGAILKVATGGTLARKFIEENKPRGVIAVACERDLSSGIHDMGFLPVMGVLNCRPNGPCFNTDVELERVENALNIMCKGG